MSRRSRVAAGVLVLMLCASVMVGCGSAAAPSTDSGSSAVPAAAGVLDGNALVDAKCTTCHPRSRVDQATKDLAGWQTTIDRMISQHGAKITPEEQSAIAIYLSKP